MPEPFVGEIRLFAFNFAPTGWAMCNGQLMPIAQNTALFSILGVNYGGNGKSSFGLPNLQGSVPLGAGQGAGLSPYTVGESGGQETVTLSANQLPVHAHNLACSSLPADLTDPRGSIPATPAGQRGQNFFASDATTLTAMNVAAVLSAGAGGPHNNLPPYLKVNFCIAMTGVYPPRP